MSAEHAERLPLAAVPAGTVELQLISGGAVDEGTAATGSRYARVWKRGMDVALSSTLLLVLLPVMLAVALLVLSSLGRPVLFRQQRVGRGGQPFTVLKFRTMHPDRRAGSSRVPPQQDRRRTHKTERDPRHTTVGRLLRRSSLDELPQLWNVLRGDMSVVGPRPELVDVVARYEPWQHRRHEVRPGLTGLWQVSERGARPMHEATEVDLRYVDSLSARCDLDILLRTPSAVLRRTGS